MTETKFQASVLRIGHMAVNRSALPVPVLPGPVSRFLSFKWSRLVEDGPEIILSWQILFMTGTTVTGWLETRIEHAQTPQASRDRAHGCTDPCEVYLSFDAPVASTNLLQRHTSVSW